MSMEPSERTIVFGLVAACIVGIIIVGGFLVFAQGMIFSSQGFSEVYFKEHQKLPAVIEENEPLAFSFEVVSHNKDTMDYSYDVYAGGEKIRSGSFFLPQSDPVGEKFTKNITIDNILLKSTLLRLNGSKISETRFTYDGGLGLLVPRDGNEPHPVIDPSKLYYPVRLPGSSETATLIFNPDASEMYQTTTTSTEKIGDLTTITDVKNAVEINGERISGVGYDIGESEWTIKNDHGIISALSKTLTSQYRYTFKKISVDVRASPVSNPDDSTYYEIHFWIVVEDPSQG